MLTGVDVSHHQGRIDWPRVAQAGHAFAIVKATEGTTRVDPRFAENWRAIPLAGLVRGAYHFLRRETPARAQAYHFVRTVDGAKGSLLAVDVETNPAGSNPLVGQVAEFVDEVRKLTFGHPVIVYTSWGWWNSHGQGSNGARLGPLWHARYRPLAQGPGPIYGGWPRFTFWQHTSTGRCPGIAGNVDLNVFYGERVDLAPLGHIPHPQPPPEDDDMKPHAVKLDQDHWAYVIPDGTIVDRVPNDQNQLVAMRAGDVEAFRNVYERDQANRRQIDVVQHAVAVARTAGF